MVAGELNSPISGSNRETPIGIFSSNLPVTFVLPRTVPATAVLLAEPPIVPISRQWSDAIVNHNPQSYPRTTINVGEILNVRNTKLAPFLERISKITSVVSMAK